MKLIVSLYVGGAIGITQDGAAAYNWLNNNRDKHNHPAALGCYIAIIRELAHDPFAYIQREVDEDGEAHWIVWSTMGAEGGPYFMVGVGDTEIEALQQAVLGFVE